MSLDVLKIASANPFVRQDHSDVASVLANMAREAAEQGASLVVFPELCLATHIPHDDFLSQDTLDAILASLSCFISQTADLSAVSVVGLPVCHEGKLYDCAAVVQGGMLLGLVPKTHIPQNQQNAYFTEPPKANLTYEFEGNFVQMGTKQIFVDTLRRHFRFCVEVGEDAHMMIPPSTYAAMAGAMVICHLSCNDDTREQTRAMLTAQSYRLVSAVVSVDSQGDALLAQDGEVMDTTVSEVDLARLAYQRRRRDTFQNHTAGEYTEVYFSTQSVDLFVEENFSESNTQILW